MNCWADLLHFDRASASVGSVWIDEAHQQHPIGGRICHFPHLPITVSAFHLIYYSCQLHVDDCAVDTPLHCDVADVTDALDMPRIWQIWRIFWLTRGAQARHDGRVFALKILTLKINTDNCVCRAAIYLSTDKTSFREMEKDILDDILEGQYDRRIRPAGANGSGWKKQTKTNWITKSGKFNEAAVLLNRWRHAGQHQRHVSRHLRHQR